MISVLTSIAIASKSREFELTSSSRCIFLHNRTQVLDRCLSAIPKGGAVFAKAAMLLRERGVVQVRPMLAKNQALAGSQLALAACLHHTHTQFQLRSTHNHTNSRLAEQ